MNAIARTAPAIPPPNPSARSAPSAFPCPQSTSQSFLPEWRVLPTDPRNETFPRPSSCRTVRALSPEAFAGVAAAFASGAEVTALDPIPAEEGLPAIWKRAPSDAPDFEALATLTPAANGEGLRVHFVLLSLPAEADAETVPPHGCAGDADLAPGESLLVGAIPVAGAPDRSLALLLECAAPSREATTNP